MMLGVYDYTVVLTYVSVLISMGGMLFSMNGYPRMAIVCLALSGFCDMFDGKIARTKKNRTEVEKKFGIQIDSLADIICFGVGPTLIAYRMGMNHGIGVTILMFYVLAGLIRLAWYNVSEKNPSGRDHGKQGMLSRTSDYFYGSCTSYFICVPSDTWQRFYHCLACACTDRRTFIYHKFQTPQAEEAGTDCHGCHCRTGSAAWTAYLVENSCKARWNRERIYERLNIK